MLFFVFMTVLVRLILSCLTLSCFLFLVPCSLCLVPCVLHLYLCAMTKKERYEFVIDYFTTHMPVAETELEFEDPYELLVAVILSAQCTDKRVNMTTPAIFKKYPTVKSLSKASIDELFPFIKSISYPNNKTKHLIGMAQKVMSDFDGKIPMTVDELVQLQGVGRKTANVITSVIDKQPNMAVDTHVFRVSKRIGLAGPSANTPFAVEKELVQHIPEEYIHKAHHWLILHGRYTCVARNPKCEDCGVRPACKYYKEIIAPSLEKK
jgi:endonuclease-3